MDQCILRKFKLNFVRKTKGTTTFSFRKSSCTLFALKFDILDDYSLLFLSLWQQMYPDLPIKKLLIKNKGVYSFIQILMNHSRCRITFCTALSY